MHTDYTGLAHRGYMRNPSHWPWIAGGAAIFVGAAATAIFFPSAPRPVTPARNQDPEAWKKLVNIEDAMPTPDDFPMGWKESLSGEKSKLFPLQLQYRLQYRILELNSPSSNACDPPCSWVAVFSGANSNHDVTQGWQPTWTREQAADAVTEAAAVVTS